MASANDKKSLLAGLWVAIAVILVLVWLLILGVCCITAACPLHKVYYGKLKSGPVGTSSGEGVGELGAGSHQL